MKNYKLQAVQQLKMQANNGSNFEEKKLMGDKKKLKKGKDKIG